MPDISPDKTLAAAYPPQTLYEAWSQQADARNMSTSQFIIRMVEAGRKQISLEEITTGSTQELRQQRADLQNELERQRDRVKKLERQLHYTAQADILEFVESNPGTTAPEITQYIANSVPERVASYLDLLEGDALERRTNGYHLTDGETATDLTSSILNPESPAESES